MTTLYGVMAEFESPATLVHAAKAVVDAGYRRFDTYSPFPIHGIDKAMALPASPLPWFVLGGGIVGACVGLGLQTWVATTAYPLVISGKPLFSYQAFVPVIFELMVLFSAFAAVFGMFALNKLPQFYHPVFTSQRFLKATSHGFFMVIEVADPLFNEDNVTQILVDNGGRAITQLKDE